MKRLFISCVASFLIAGSAHSDLVSLLSRREKGTHDIESFTIPLELIRHRGVNELFNYDKVTFNKLMVDDRGRAALWMLHKDVMGFAHFVGIPEIVHPEKVFKCKTIGDLRVIFGELLKKRADKWFFCAVFSIQEDQLKAVYIDGRLTKEGEIENLRFFSGEKPLKEESYKE